MTNSDILFLKRLSLDKGYRAEYGPPPIFSTFCAMQKLFFTSHVTENISSCQISTNLPPRPKGQNAQVDIHVVFLHQCGQGTSLFKYISHSPLLLFFSQPWPVFTSLTEIIQTLALLLKNQSPAPYKKIKRYGFYCSYKLLF